MRTVTLLAILCVSTAASAQVRILQTNSQGDNIHLIDPTTHQIVGEIKGVPINHGAAAAPDGSRFYFSSEAEQTLHVVDGKSLQVTKTEWFAAGAGCGRRASGKRRGGGASRRPLRGRDGAHRHRVGRPAGPPGRHLGAVRPSGPLGRGARARG